MQGSKRTKQQQQVNNVDSQIEKSTISPGLVLSMKGSVPVKSKKRQMHEMTGFFEQEKPVKGDKRNYYESKGKDINGMRKLQVVDNQKPMQAASKGGSKRQPFGEIPHGNNFAVAASSPMVFHKSPAKQPSFGGKKSENSHKFTRTPATAAH